MIEDKKITGAHTKRAIPLHNNIARIFCIGQLKFGDRIARHFNASAVDTACT